MTLVRRLALKISDAVVRYASPGCKEWAEGLAREVAFVEGDWAALGWALGSVRVLFDYREAPIGSLADLPAVAQRLAESKRIGNATWIGMPIWVLIYCDKFFHAASWPERAGCGLAALGWLSPAIVVFIEWRRRLKVPPSDDITALIRFYKTELERGRDLYRSPTGWVAASAFTMLCVGLLSAERDGVRAHPAWDALVGLIWVGALLLYFYARRIGRRRLERLDALLAETDPDSL
jgi:hypothetical protein